MRSAAGRISLKIVTLLGCIACVVTKALTDQLSRRVFLRNQKLSREWGLLHNLYWSASGNAFANVTYGGFTLITVLMLISRFIDAKSRPSLVEKIFLTVGMLCFFAMGGVVFSAFDQVPSDLHINAIVLGCLSFFVAFLMLIDLADPMARHISDTTQTDFPIPTGQLVQPEIHKITPQRIEEPRPTLPPSNANNGHIQDVSTLNGKYIRGEEVDIVQAHRMPSAEQPIFEKLLLPEKQRPHRQNIPDPHANRAHLQYHAAPAYNIDASRHRAPSDRPPVPYRSQYDARPPSQTYSRSNAFRAQPPTQTNQHREHMSRGHYNIRTSPPTNRHASSCRRTSNCSDSSNEEENHRSLRPGFVANAARFWDQRAKQNEGLNTIV